MKICTLCKQYKDLDLFPRDRHKKSGLKSRCKSCEAELARVKRLDNPEAGKAASKRYRDKNTQKERERYQRYNRLRPEVRAHLAAKRRAVVKSATPSWLTEDQINEIRQIYNLARDCTLTSGIPYQVDHIVPLTNPKVCGLHVPWNLQVLPADLNHSKSNSYE